VSVEYLILIVVWVSSLLIVAFAAAKYGKRQKAERTIYVPTVLTDTREYAEKWQDQGYLTTVKGFSGNNVYKTEVLYALDSLRRVADSSDIDTQQLKGMNYGIRAIKGLLVLPEKASAQLQLMRAQHENTEKRKADSFG